MINKRAEQFVMGVGFCLLYICAGRVGLSLAFLNSSASPVWPPAGLALAGLLIFGLRLWPAVFLGAFIVNFTTMGHIGASLAIATGNMLEAVLGAILMRRVACGASCFGNVPGIFRFVFFAALPSTLLSAIIGMTSLATAGRIAEGTFLHVGLTWWTGDLVSDLVLAPLLVVWLYAPAPRLRPARVIELVLLLLVLGAMSMLAFGPWNSFAGERYPLGFLILPPMLWAAYRFRERGAVVASVLVSTIAIFATVAGSGPFALRNPNDSLLMLQAFVGTNTLSLLVLAALVAERTRSEDSLVQSQRRLLMALDAGKMGTWDWDIATGHVQWSAALAKLHGLPDGSVQGTFSNFIEDIHPEDRQRIRGQIALTLEGRHEQHTQYRLLLKDGSVRWMEGHGQLVRNRLGQPARLLGVAVDVTEQNLAQQERERLLERERAARAEAERANRSKDNFLAILSHELRTPLTPVLLTASLLENDPKLPKSIHDDVLMIRRNVEMEARLIDDLLDLTRITRGKLQLELQTTDLHEVIHRAIDICFRGTAVNLKLLLEARHHHLLADPGRIQQVLWNLLNNARKFTPADGTISVRSVNPDDSTILVEVSDTGVGISPEALPKLFLAFEQGDSVEAKRAGGLGLGLAISKALVTGHSGTLTVASEGVGHGATFSVSFPTVRVPAVRVPENGDGVPHIAKKRARILLVEDNAVTLMALERLLTSRNHHVVSANSVASAKEAAARESVDLVVSDLGLPDGVGYDLMRDLKSCYGIPGIAVSGYGMPADIDQSIEAGFAEHLVKPVDASTLEAAILRALNSQRG